MRAYGASDPGLCRERNEDAFMVDVTRGLFAVADGLGGLPHGEVASQTAMSVLEDVAAKELKDLGSIVAKVQNRVRRESVKRAERLGTTLTLAYLAEGFVHIAQVGDSIAFVHDGTVDARRVTRDQTLAEQMREGGEARVPEYAEHILTQCIGQGGRVEPDLLSVAFPAGARLLLCSDGVSAVLDDDSILAAVAEADSPEVVVSALIARANALGGPDNITAVAVFND